MKFGQLLKTHAVSAWSSQYLAYHDLKKLIYAIRRKLDQIAATAAVAAGPTTISVVGEAGTKPISIPQPLHPPLPQVTIPHGVLPPSLEPDFTTRPIELRFFLKLHRELKKIESFYAEQLNKLQARFVEWFQTVERLQAITQGRGYEGAAAIKVKEAEATLVREAEELYWSINMMRNYITLNSTGIAKILKKFDKVTNFTTKSRYLEFIHSLSWFNTKEIDTYAREIEDLFALVFTAGDRKKAMSALRIPRVKREDEKSSFFIGFFLGMCVAISLLTLFLLSISNLDTVPHWNDVYLVYRCVFLPIILLWLFAVNCAVWTRTRIDHVFILELDPRRHITHQQLFLLSGILTTGLLISALCYLFQARGDFRLGLPAQYFPLLGVLFLGVVLFCPFNIFFRGSRWWLLRTVSRIVTSPMHKIEFRDFFIADQLTSLAMFFGDFQFVICYYLYGFWSSSGEQTCQLLYFGLKPVFAALPYVWRVLQCLRRYRDTKEFTHIWNTFKYCTGLLVIFFSSIAGREETWTSYKVLWLCSVILATCYTYCWDVFMDWGLVAPGAKYRLLRPGLQYKYYQVYYLAMVSNLLLRLSWTLTISPDSIGIRLHDDLFGFLLATGEVTRRFQWNFFRMENEHVNNCGKFRASKEIPLPPLDFDPPTSPKILHRPRLTGPRREYSNTGYGTLTL